MRPRACATLRSNPVAPPTHTHPRAAPLPQATRINALLSEMRRGMEELQLGLDGALNMSDRMEALARAFAAGKVPDAWMSVMSTRVQEVRTAPGPGALRPES